MTYPFPAEVDAAGQVLPSYESDSLTGTNLREVGEHILKAEHNQKQSSIAFRKTQPPREAE